MLGRFIFSVLLCTAVAASAHQDESETDVSALDCAHLPETAVTAIPGMIGQAGRLVCIQGVQRIVANQGWSWRYSGSFFNTPNIPAHAHIDSQGMTPPFYFKAIRLEKLSSDEANIRSAQLSEQIVTYRPGNKIAGMSIVEVENNYGNVTEIFMPMQSDNSGWMIVCTPDCQPDYVIVISKLEAR